jgi:alpha-1,3-mannosyltransferase
VPISVDTVSQTVERLDARFERGNPAIVAYVNAHVLNLASRDERFRTVLRNSVLINDGIGVDIASLFLFGSTFPLNLTATDFFPHYLRNTRHRYRIFLLGSLPGIAERTAAILVADCPQHQIVGWHHGHFPKNDTAKIIDMIKASNADIVLAGMGNPIQELWLADNLPTTGCRLGFAVGALFDFLTGHAHRAPSWMRYAGLEWLHRLVQEPARLWRRYLIGNPVFIVRVLGQWLAGGPGDPP